MAGFDVRLIGDRALEKQFKALTGPEQKKIVRRAIREGGAKPIAASARSTAPIDTGALKASIKVRAGKRRGRQGRRGDISINVVTLIPYGPAVELGTKYQSATRFLRGPTDQMRPQVVAKIGHEVGRGLVKLMQKMKTSIPAKR